MVAKASCLGVQHAKFQSWAHCEWAEWVSPTPRPCHRASTGRFWGGNTTLIVAQPLLIFQIFLWFSLITLSHRTSPELKRAASNSSRSVAAISEHREPRGSLWDLQKMCLFAPWAISVFPNFIYDCDQPGRRQISSKQDLTRLRYRPLCLVNNKRSNHRGFYLYVLREIQRTSGNTNQSAQNEQVQPTELGLYLSIQTSKAPLALKFSTSLIL